MDPGMPMILPKGIVTNTEYIYEEVAGFPFVPPDKLWKYWHVYTTTHKKLRDPTAGRLENFWWHVWGSDRRFLKGSTLAKLYEDISVGPTVVPLRGPPNRWEGPDVPPLLRQIMEAVQAEEARRHQPSQQPQPSPKPREQALRTLSSSASKPPPSHPILKKARGPSSSGPRPTARFVSPHESDEEDEIPSSGSTAATDSEVPIYAVSPKKKVSTAPIKKHLAPVAAPTAKIRSLKPKRTQVHPPHTSEMSKEKSSSVGSRQANVQPPTKLIVERPLEQVTSPSEESVSSFNSHEPPVMSEKARGKQPVKPLRPITELNGIPKQKQERRTSAHHEQPPVKRKEKPALPQAQSLVDLTRHSRRSSGTSRSTFGVGSLESGSTGVDVPPLMARSSSHTGYERSSSAARLPGIGLLTGATTSTSNIAAQGTILDQSGLSALPLPPISDETSHSTSIQPSAPSILDSRFVPTRPTTSASVPLGRTKSQLTLLLEREKARTGNKPRSKS